MRDEVVSEPVECVVPSEFVNERQEIDSCRWKDPMSVKQKE